IALNLSAVASRMEPRSAAAILILAMSKTTDPDALRVLSENLAVVLAPADPPSTPQLVELLKHPLCVGEARRVVLDQLGRRYSRRFADQWEFVRFAEKQKLGLDFTSRVQRP